MPFHPVARALWREGRFETAPRDVAAEVPVAFTYNGTSHAVMMATPADLQDFARGFSLSEAMVDGIGEIESIEAIDSEAGIELRLWVAAERMARIMERRRRLTGPTGCGLCGIESLEEALPAVRRVEGEVRLDAEGIFAALAALAGAQAINRATRAVHAAGFWRAAEGRLVAAREDVGRHNALDKLIGALAGAGETAQGGAVVLTSRISVEMVQKAAVLGAPALIAVSAPTSLAIRTAERAGITLVGIARGDGFEVFTHPQRIVGLAA